MKKTLLLISLILSSFSYSQNGGACIYMLPDSTIQCYITGNAGVGSQNQCMSDAIAAGAIPIDCLNTPFTSCASFYVTNGVACFFGGTGSCGGGSPCDLLFLPIELYKFEGVVKDRIVVLNWTTISELNNDYFTLEHSLDGVEWGLLAVIDGAGTSQQTLEYSYEHRIDNILNYYRLKQTDFDGKFEIFKTIALFDKGVKRKVVKQVDLMGREVDEYYKGIIIKFYDDGSTNKGYKK